MPDDPKSPSTPPPEGEPKPTADKPAVPSGVKATASGSVQADVKTPAEKDATLKKIHHISPFWKEPQAAK